MCGIYKHSGNGSPTSDDFINFFVMALINSQQITGSLHERYSLITTWSLVYVLLGSCTPDLMILFLQLSDR
jgi:hypothetical protein